MMEGGGFLGMCLAEWRKARGRGLAWAVLLFGLLHGIAGAGAIWIGARAEAKMVTEAVDSSTWLVAGELAVSLAALPINGLALLLLFAMLWAEDFSLGTIAMVFVRPVPRWKVFAAKATVGMAVALTTMALALVMGLALGLPLFGLEGDLSRIGAETPMIGWMGAAEGSVFLTVLAGLLTGTYVVLPVLAVAAFLGALTRSPVLTLFGSMMVLLADAGVAAVLAIWNQFEVGRCQQDAINAGQVKVPEDLDGLACPGADLPQRLHDLTIWAGRDFLGMRGHPEFWAEATTPMLVTLGWSALFLGLGWLLFTRRDLS